MAKQPNQGIMALPQKGQESMPQQAPLGILDAHDAVRQGLQETSPVASQNLQEAMAPIVQHLDQLDDKQLDALIFLVTVMHDRPEMYKEVVQKLVESGLVDAGTFPEEYDAEFVATLGSALMEAKRTRTPEQGAAAPMEPPMKMARGGIAEAVRKVAAQGRDGDTMLAHINPQEAALLKAHGGSGTINPHTGLREFLSISVGGVGVSIGGDGVSVNVGNKSVSTSDVLNAGVDVIKGGVNAAVDLLKPVATLAKATLSPVIDMTKSVLASPIGKIAATAALATFLGPGALGITGLELGAVAMPLAAGTITALSGGSTKDILKNATIAYLAAPGGAVSNYVSSLGLPAGIGITAPAAAAALNAGMIGTGAGLLTGQSLKDSLKSGLTTAAVAAAATAAKSPAEAAQANNAPTDVTAKTEGQAPVPGQPGTPSGGPLTVEDVQKQINNPSQYALQAPASSGQGIKALPATGEGYDLAASTGGGQGLQPPTAITAQPGWNLGLSDTVRNQESLANRIEAAANGAPAKDGTSSGGGGKTGIPAPTIGDSLSTTWEGITSGDLSKVGQGLGDLFMPSGDAGLLRTYGPALGAGLLATGALGGFKPGTVGANQRATDIASGKATQDIINANPNKYLLQNMSGVQYDAKGNIIGSSPWTPGTQGAIEQKGANYVPYTPSVYNTPIGAMGGGRQVQQPYNTSAMYTNLMRPRYAADGGYMSAAPTFPGTPLTTDAGPMMAQQSHPLSMNTPGVPMNQPMGFAMGGMPPAGIATLAPGGYPRRTGQISGPGTETSDDIPAMLSDGEFVMTAKAVKALGKGNRREGAKKMYALMHRLEKNAARG